MAERTLSRVRQAQNLTKSGLARKAGLNQATVFGIESGRLNPYPSQLAKLARALGWMHDPALLLEEVDD